MFMSARVSETMPLYDILNEFQKGHSHMAVVVREHNDTEQSAIENPTGKHLFMQCHALFTPS
jgi:hypothetical protein